MPFREIKNVVHRTYRSPDKPMPVEVVNRPPTQSEIQKKNPAIHDGSWRKEPPININQQYPLVNSSHIKKLLDIV